MPLGAGFSVYNDKRYGMSSPCILRSVNITWEPACCLFRLWGSCLRFSASLASVCRAVPRWWVWLAAPVAPFPTCDDQDHRVKGDNCYCVHCSPPSVSETNMQILFISMEPRSGELRTQKLNSHLLRTQSLKVLPIKPGGSQYIAIRATLTATDIFLGNFYLPGPFTRIFSKTSPECFLY